MDDQARERLSMLMTAYMIMIGPDGSSSGELYARATEFDTTLHLHKVVLQVLEELELAEVSDQDWVNLTQKGREIVWQEALNLNRLLAERN